MLNTGKKERVKDASEQTGNAVEELQDTILLRIARIAYGAPVRWKREIRDDKTNGNPSGIEEAEQQDTVQYRSRLLACTSRN